jgi:hypothetical protein
MAFRSLSRIEFNFSLIAWPCFILLALNALFFIVAAASPHVLSDVWRHLREIVIPFLEGTEGLSILWSNHHASPVLHILQIINIKIFGFRLDYDALLGFFFQIITTIFLLIGIRASAIHAEGKVGVLGALCVLLIIAIQLGFNSTIQYTWPLVGTVQYLYCFFIITLLLADRCTRRESTGNYLATAAFSLILVFANTSYGSIFLVSIFGTLMLIYLVERRAAYLRVALVIFIVWAAYFFLQLYFIQEQEISRSSSPSGLYNSFFGQPLFRLKQFSLALGVGLVDIRSFSNYKPDAEIHLIAFSLLIAVFFGVVLVTFLKRKAYRITLMPLGLMISSIVFAAALLANRGFWVGDIWSLSASRYVPTYKLGIVGMIWAAWLVYRPIPLVNEKPFFRLGAIAISLVVIMVLLLQGMQIVTGWKEVPRLREKNAKAAWAIYLAASSEDHSVELPLYIKGYPQHSKNFESVFAYLVKNRLNVFSDNFPASAILDQQLNSRALFESASGSMILKKREGKYREIHRDSFRSEVSWTTLEPGIDISNTSNESIQIRMEVTARRYLSRGLILSRPSEGVREKMGVSSGRQVLFFSLGGGDRLIIEADWRASIVKIEMRV